MMNNEVVSRIAQKIRATRMKRNMTIQQVADRTKLTKGLLSKIENSRTLPSLPVLIEIITALEISLKEFFEDMALANGKDFVFVRRQEQSKIERERRNGFHYNLIISQSIAPSNMEVVLLTLEPGATGRPTTTDGYEFKYMISGECEYHINNEIIHMTEGDSLYFDASIPHLPVNKSNRSAIMLVTYYLTPKS
jgi:transcriptional regulator with XRE-family HTH domain